MAMRVDLWIGADDYHMLVKEPSAIIVYGHLVHKLAS